MDDGGAAACTIVLFFALLLIEAILYGFSKAIYLMNEKEIERRAQEENDKKSIALLGIVQHSTIYVNSIQMITTLIDLVMGCFYTYHCSFCSNFLPDVCHAYFRYTVAKKAGTEVS